MTPTHAVYVAAGLLTARLLWVAPAPPAHVDGFLHGMGLLALAVAVIWMLSDG